MIKEEISLGKINIAKYGECNIKIENLERSVIPHIHIRDSKNETICCIELFKPKYYRGHNDDKHIKLSNSECEILDYILNQNAKYFEFMSEWEYAVWHWEAYENKLDLWSDDYRIPDYTKLRKRKD